MPLSSTLQRGGFAAAAALCSVLSSAQAATFSSLATVDLTFLSASSAGSLDGLSAIFQSAGGELITTFGDASATPFADGSGFASSLPLPDYSVIVDLTGEAGENGAAGFVSAEADVVANILFANDTSETITLQYDLQWLVDSFITLDGQLPVEDAFAFAELALELDGQTVFEQSAFADQVMMAEAFEGFDLLEIVLAPNSERNLSIFAIVGGDALAEVPLPAAAFTFLIGAAGLGSLRRRRPA
ncbi:MAG: VPLPA-CTERM sorting domain-containing protein [Parvularcula sp.]|jgi:hypothetical protein|nr:VPLPA-CTERM sorting domain-containing protein [Parvularcula sp.]